MKDHKDWTMEDCREAHLRVKMHPWRSSRDMADLHGYCKEVVDFIRGSLYAAKLLGENDLSYKVVSNMYHDFIGAAVALRATNGIPVRQRNRDGSVEDDDTLTMVENCLGVLHRFCNGERIDRYWVYYTGCNNIPGVRRFHAMKWREPASKYGKGRFVRELPLEELKLILAYFEKDAKCYENSIRLLKEDLAELEAAGKKKEVHETKEL